jgi:MSHA biogenesis protein MshN
MSLINDVLKDLERRQSDTASTTSRPGGSSTRPTRRFRVLGWWLVAAVCVGITLHLSLNHLTPEPPQATTVHASLQSPEPIRPAVIDVDEQVTERPATETPVREIPTTVTGQRSQEDPAPTVSDPPTVAVEPSRVSELAGSQPVARREETIDTVAATDKPTDERPSPAPPVRQVATAPERQAEASQDEPRRDISIERADEQRSRNEIERARRAFAAHRYGQAESMLRALLEHNPADDEARELLATQLIRRDRHRRAITVLEDGLDAASDPARFARRLGRLFMELGNPARARDLLEGHAPDIDQDPDFHQLLAAAYRQAGDHASAEAAYRQLTLRTPQRSAAWIGLGASLESLDRPQDAHDAYRQALDTHDDPRAIRFARQRLRALGNAYGDRP